MSTWGVRQGHIMSTLGMFSTLEGYHKYIRGYHEYIGGIS